MGIGFDYCVALLSETRWSWARDIYHWAKNNRNSYLIISSCQSLDVAKNRLSFPLDRCSSQSNRLTTRSISRWRMTFHIIKTLQIKSTLTFWGHSITDDFPIDLKKLMQIGDEYSSSSYSLFIVTLYLIHYNDVTMRATASHITSLTIVYSTVYSGAEQRTHLSSAPMSSDVPQEEHFD